MALYSKVRWVSTGVLGYGSSPVTSHPAYVISGVFACTGVAGLFARARINVSLRRMVYMVYVTLTHGYVTLTFVAGLIDCARINVLLHRMVYMVYVTLTHGLCHLDVWSLALMALCGKPWCTTFFVAAGSEKVVNMSVEEMSHINPGPANTLDDIPIPFKPLEEAKKDFMPTFNAYFYGSLIVFVITFYWAFVVEDLWMYDARMPVKSYRDRHKGKKPSGDGGNKAGAAAAAAAAAGTTLAIEENKKESPESSEGDGAFTEVEHSAVNRKERAVARDPAAQPEEATGKRSTAQDPNKLPEQIPYLLVGSGTASYYAALAIRARDADAKVLIVGEEEHLPYTRTPLSKELWWYGDEDVSETLEYKGYSGRRRDVYFEAPGFFLAPGEIDSAEHGGVALVSGHRVVKLDVPSHTAYLDDGRTLKYGKCLIATGDHL
ncbi:unnamed protein product [Gongylonema pulchrum]|uniref:Pyr_redox_2 domain-containing protein n=1 Tax=Gongylonema pulchrum TaxID=637853 RepID=A0A183DRF6_9BILA|nr:unnamed protein product [Gongylonema pulchrum]